MAQRLARVILIAGIAASVGFLAILIRDDRSAPPIIIEDAPSDVNVVVWIGGEVANPGVYKLPFDSRLNDVIVAAGGLTGSADVSSINLASRLEDEQRIEIPTQQTASLPGSEATPSSFGIRTIGSSPTATSDDRININSADADELDELPGIGPVIAERIIDFREENGSFASIQELARVDGISATMVDEMSDLITVGP